MSQNFPGQYIEMMQRHLSQYGRIGATKIIRAPRLSAAIALGSPTEVSAPAIRWPKKGTVIAMLGQELAGTAAKFASTEVAVEMGSENLITDGGSPEFLPMLLLFGPNLNWMPLLRRVTPQSTWQVRYRNYDGAATATPTVAFAVIQDADIDDMASNG